MYVKEGNLVRGGELSSPSAMGLESSEKDKAGGRREKRARDSGCAAHGGRVER